MALRSVVQAVFCIAAAHWTSAAHAIDYEPLTSEEGVPFIVIEGDFKFGDQASELAKVAAETGATFVTFNSHGGDLFSAMQHGRLIRALGLHTVQVRDFPCSSACALAFLGGVERYAVPGSIGVHRSYFVSGSTLNRDGAVAVVQQMTAEVLSYLDEMGVDPDFLRLSLEYGSDDMRYLSGSEMAQMKVTTPATVTSNATEAPTPQLSPAQPQPASDLEAEVKTFVERLIGAHMAGDKIAISMVLRDYGTTVRYYGKSLPLHEVVRDKRAYFQRWPHRIYRLQPDTISIACSATWCEVSGVYEWLVSSFARKQKASGTATFNYVVDITQGMRVVGEGGSVLSQ